jgi:NAD+ synthase (glutamine-hydrolysing)
MRIALGQINSTVGDFAGNKTKILDYVARAHDKNADVVVFPELALFGYSPMDLLERPTAVECQLKELSDLHKQLPKDVAVIVGAVTKSKKKTGKPYHNSAVVLIKGKKPIVFNKELLPTYDVFDEARYVEPGDMCKNFFKFKGTRFHVTICEDIWAWDLPKNPSPYVENPVKKVKKNSSDVMINISASPFTHEKFEIRKAVVKKTAQHINAPVVYVNLVGAQDEVIFDGASFVMNTKGKICSECLMFEEDLNVFDLETEKGGAREQKLSDIEKTRAALVLGIRDFLRKNGMDKVHLGLSGGIDSAVVACLAVDALGPSKVTGITLPGPFNAPESKTLGEQLAKNLGIRCLNFDIGESYEAAVGSLEAELGKLEFGLAHENIQARLRGMLLMALSNKEGSMLLTTGNKDEYATGYSTLYGDMCGGLAPIADLVKGEVYDLAKLYNKESEVIPKKIITRAPSAELRPNQKDQDSLPEYDKLDEGVRKMLEEQKPAKSDMERWLMNAIVKNEFKRWQAPPILKVTKRSFGRGRRYPIANKFRF